MTQFRLNTLEPKQAVISDTRIRPSPGFVFDRHALVDYRPDRRQTVRLVSNIKASLLIKAALCPESSFVTMTGTSCASR